jgi:uncharacterized protein (DUF1501 family)
MPAFSKTPPPVTPSPTNKWGSGGVGATGSGATPPRRLFLQSLGAATCSILLAPAFAQVRPKAGYDNLLIVVELKGGNDGLNTVVPYTDRNYYQLRPRIAIPRDKVLQLDDRTGLHPSLVPLMPMWKARELAVIQGVGYPSPNLSHFRSIEIWDTASGSDEALTDGWLARAFSESPPPVSFAADGVVVGSAEAGPLEGVGPRVITLANTQQFLRQARLATPEGRSRNPALDHILKVEADIVQAARGLSADHEFRTEFPGSPFGNAVKTACQAIAGKDGVAAVKLSLNGFDTHSNQPATQERLLKELAEGVVALRSALMELGRWSSALVLTYAEFGRRPKENQSNGTDHGTANAHFMLGGRVRGGLIGAAPRLDRLDGAGNVAFGVDFRSIYATVLEQWWELPSQKILQARHPTLDVLKSA